MGTRKVGKTWWPHRRFAANEVRFIDLLHTDVFAELASRPALLRERWDGRLTVIDEVQKLPALLIGWDRRPSSAPRAYTTLRSPLAPLIRGKP